MRAISVVPIQKVIISNFPKATKTWTIKSSKLLRPSHNMSSNVAFIVLQPTIIAPVIVSVAKCALPKTLENWLVIKVTCSLGAYYRHNNLRKPKGGAEFRRKLLFVSQFTELFYKQCLQQ